MTGQRPNMTVNHSVLQQRTLMQRNIQLAIISIEMMRYSIPRDHAAQWSGIEGEKQRT